MIEFKKVTATYKKDVGIFDISLKVEPGEMVFLMGPTGAGKSTVLRAIYKGIDLSKGKIMIDNQDISKLSKYQIPLLRRKIGMIFQDFKLLNNRTVLENVALPLQILGLDSDEIYDKVNESLIQVGLTKLYNSYPYQLSGGEQQRVGIARALVKTPKIILADEPTGNLDPKKSENIIELLTEINAKGTTIIIATHDYHVIKKFNSRIIKCIDQKICEIESHEL